MPSSNPVLRARRNRQIASATRCCEASPASRQRSSSLVIAGIVYEVIHLAWPAISKFGIGFVTTNDWNPVTETLRRGAVPLRDGGDLGDRAAPRGAALDRDLDLPDRAGAAAATAPGGDAGRHARRDPDRHPRALGDPRPRPRHARHDRASAAERARLPADLQRRPLGFRLPDRCPDPHDHDHADHHQRHSRGLRDGAGRPQGGLLRARRDPLGDGPPGRPALLARRASSARRSSASAARSARRSRSPR